MPPVISVEGVSKRYQLGSISSSSLRQDFERWLARFRNAPDPYATIGGPDRDSLRGEFIWALRDISFTLDQGEVLGIIGRNGSGKSTLLKILSRVTAPTDGRARIKGRVASLLEVGTGFHPDLTGRENVFLNGAILGMTRAEVRRKFDEIVDFSGVEQFIDTPVKRYSSGMNVRLAFAVAAHLEPEILIVDEVLAVGDAEFQKKSLGKMGAVVQEGRTVLFVSHNTGAVQSLCTQAIWLRAGQLQLAGETEDVLDAYFKAGGHESAVMLGQRTDRKGSGALRLTAIEYWDSAGEPVRVAQSGQDVQIALRYQADRDDLRNVSVDMAILNVSGQHLFILDSAQTGDQFAALPREGYLICSIPRLGLLPGPHPIDVRCRVNGRVADQVLNAAELTVDSGDFFGSGHFPPSHQRGTLVAHNWRAAPVMQITPVGKSNDGIGRRGG